MKSGRFSGWFRALSGREGRIRLAGMLSLVVLAATFLCLYAPDLALAQDEPMVKSKTLLSYVQDGGIIGGVIILCSIAGLSLTIAFAFQVRRDVLVPPELLAQVEQLFEDEDYEEAFHVCEANPSFLSHVLTAGLAKMEEGYEQLEEAMAETEEIESTKLHQKVGYLQLIAALSPMLGLFGTVFGMIQTFNVIATSPVQPKPADLAGGISTALTTTFMGLFVAIPMTVVYMVFRNKVVNVVAEIGGITDELMGRFRTTS